jgi:hypothetical protein
MSTFITPRLRLPAGYLAAGTIFAAAWLARGGPSWWLAIAIEVTVIVPAVTSYVRSGRDDTLVAGQPDERQRLVSTRSRALAGSLAWIAAFAGITVAVALRSPAWWPFAIILAVASFGYLLGLSTYGVGEEGPADDADSDYDAFEQTR